MLVLKLKMYGGVSHTSGQLYLLPSFSFSIRKCSELKLTPQPVCFWSHIYNKQISNVYSDLEGIFSVQFILFYHIISITR